MKFYLGLLASWEATLAVHVSVSVSPIRVSLPFHIKTFLCECVYTILPLFFYYTLYLNF